MAREKKKRKGLIITLSIVLSVILLLLFALIFVGFSIKDLKASVEKKQTKVEQAFDARELETEALVKLLKPRMDLDPEVFTNLEKAEKILKNAKGVKAKSDANIKVDEAINAIVDTMEDKYPHLQPDFWNSGVAEDIDTARARLVSACSVYNKAADEYNYAIQNFPGSFIASVSGYEGVDEFKIADYKDLAN